MNADSPRHSEDAISNLSISNQPSVVAADELQDSMELPSQGRKRFEGLLVGAYALAFLFAFGGVLGVAITAIPLKATEIAPDNPTGVVSLVSAVGTLVSLVVGPIVGRLSDRTTARMGMRRPWLIAGAAILPFGYLLSARADSAAALAIGFSLVQVGSGFIIAALLASVADQFPPNRRGLVSGLMGGAQTFGIVVVAFILTAVGPGLTPMFLVPGLLTAAAAVLFAVVLPDRRLAPDDRAPMAWREVPGTFWVNPVRHRDFGFAWFSRFAIFVGIAAVNTYQAFYLIMHLHVPPTEIAGRMATSALVLAVASTIGALISGRVSDRLNRRKPFVIVAAVIFGIGLTFISFVDNFSSFLIGIAVLGFGQGIYLAVDLILVTQVLPSKATIGKDMGVLNIANVLPGSLVPAVAPMLLAIGSVAGAPNFPSLFIAAAVVALVGAALILPIRKVR